MKTIKNLFYKNFNMRQFITQNRVRKTNKNTLKINAVLNVNHFIDFI